MLDMPSLYLQKALESLAGAETAYANGRYNNCANRSYYACFQGAIAALMRAGVRPRGASGEWSHAFVPSQFDGELINRRKRFPATLRGMLSHDQIVRVKADYRPDEVSQAEAIRALRRCRSFVAAVQSEGGGAS